MQCTQCNYSLWNSKPGACPECGQPYRVSDYYLPKEQVSFRCPHCDYANRPNVVDEQGLPVPKQFRCAGCDQYIEVNQTTVSPDDPKAEAYTGTLPWALRSQIGFWKAWARTIGLALRHPHQLIQRLPTGDNDGQPLYFLLVNAALYGFVTGMGWLILLALIYIMAGATGGGEMLMFLISTAVSVFASGVAVVVMAAIFAAVAHLLLVITGATRGFNTTMAAVCYSSSPVLLMSVVHLIPFCGMYLAWAGWLGWAITAGVMLCYAHDVPGWRATLAAAATPATTVLLCVGACVGWMYTINSMATPGGAGWNTVTATGDEAQLEWMYGELDLYRLEHNRWPSHAAELILDQPGSVQMFGSFEAGTYSQPPDMGLSPSYWALGSPQQTAELQALVDAQPTLVTAHRMGDFVFLWHKLPLTNPDAQLWLAISSPNPDAGNNWTPQNYRATVLLADGTTQSIDQKDLPSRLTTQNILRQKLGLPMIPTLKQVTHKQPYIDMGPGSRMEWLHEDPP